MMYWIMLNITRMQAPAPGVASASGQSPASGQLASAQASSQGSAANKGAIIGGAVAAAVVVAILALVAACLVARRRRRSLQDRALSAYEADHTKQGSANKVSCADMWLQHAYGAVFFYAAVAVDA